MTELPTPRNVRRGWVLAPISTAEALELMRKCFVPESYGEVIAARLWKVARGLRRGEVKRVDALFSTGATASVRFSSGRYTTRMGPEAAR